MEHTKQRLHNIPTNLITGFLGVGKTSAILHLMTQKPADQKWSVLVNEFGSVGIDGAIYKAKGIDVKEIPGGCMCCAAGVPLQVAVNRILRETQPHRVLIEPSGLGHPKRVLDTLQGEHFKEALSLKASICLIDPRNLSDDRYTTHENFIDQIAIADIVVANKKDVCDKDSLEHFDKYMSAFKPAKQAIIKTQYGQLDAELLDYEIATKRETKFPHFHSIRNINDSKDDKIRDGYYSEGWRYPKETVFNFDKLNRYFYSFENTRIKAIFNTNKGWMIFNIQDVLKEIHDIDSSNDSRLEMISRDQTLLNKNEVESEIMNCRVQSGD